MPERSRPQSRGRRAWSMRVARPGSHPAAGAGAWPRGGRLAPPLRWGWGPSGEGEGGALRLEKAAAA